jgi:hypothetical protein
MHMRKPLDAGQQRELDFQRAQQKAEQEWGPAWALAAGLAAVMALIVGLISWAAGGPWAGLGFALLAFAVMAAVQAPRVSWPDKAAERAVRAATPTLESMRCGDQNRNWPG